MLSVEPAAVVVVARRTSAATSVVCSVVLATAVDVDNNVVAVFIAAVVGIRVVCFKGVVVAVVAAFIFVATCDFAVGTHTDVALRQFGIPFVDDNKS